MKLYSLVFMSSFFFVQHSVSDDVMESVLVSSKRACENGEAGDCRLAGSIMERNGDFRSSTYYEKGCKIGDSGSS